MNKKNKFIYWIATAWLALGMFSTGLVQLLKVRKETDLVHDLGYPIYILTILGVWKLLGVVTVLIPKFRVLKEWAYAGFFFSMSGAVISHFAVGDAINKIFPPFLLLVLTMVSWYFRPADRKFTNNVSL